MASQLIQFRLSGIELEALKAYAHEGESLNLAAQRFLKERLVDRSRLIEAVDNTEVSTVQLQEEIAAQVAIQIAPLQQRLEALEEELGKSAA
jgi:hypothetical protein